LPHVIEVEVIGDHRLRVVFDDGVEGEIDASRWSWDGVFAPLKDPEFFAQVKLDGVGSIAWPNGVDVAPEALHNEARGVGSIPLVRGR
jgi:hypothetical protein